MQTIAISFILTIGLMVGTFFVVLKMGAIRCHLLLHCISSAGVAHADATAALLLRTDHLELALT